VKSIVEIRIVLVKQRKLLFKQCYQTISKYFLSVLGAVNLIDKIINLINKIFNCQKLNLCVLFIFVID